jgi:hypothetical protein
MSKTRFEILAAAAQTATGQGGGISVSGIKSMLVAVDITASTGTLTSVYLQGSSDGGTTWFDLLCTSFCIFTSGSGGGTTGSYSRNLTTNLATGQIQKIAATYAVVGDYIRAAWTANGSAPSISMSVKAIGEN